VYTTVEFLGEPEAIFDFASLSFHAPTLGSAAKATASAVRQNTVVNTNLFVCIRLSPVQGQMADRQMKR
jgi:hypothetical protein